MCRPDDRTATEAAAWVSTARRLAAAGALTDAMAAYERAFGALDRPGSDSGWRIDVLGGFRVLVGDRPVDLGTLRPQHRVLLQVLCAHAGRPVPDARLIGWFWPDAEPAPARHRLTVGVSALRSLLTATGGPVLVRDEDGYVLRMDGDGTDARTFERLLTAARVARREDRVPRLELALAAYGGDLLPAAGEAEWVLAERDRLRDGALWAAAELADAHARAGRPREVVRVARAGLRWDRHHDRLWRRLVGALTELAEPAAAAKARREYTAVLADLGVVAWPTADRTRTSA